MTQVVFQSKDHNEQNMQSVYWFNTPLGVFGVIEGCGADGEIIDHDGFSIEGWEEERQIEEILSDVITDELRMH